MHRIKKVLILAVLLLPLACTPDRYKLEGKHGTQWFLDEFIGLQAEKRIIAYKPLIVVDGKIYRPNIELKNERLPFSKSEIASIEVVSKAEGTKRYGEDGKRGALLIQLKKNK